jgi:hypothetical protein
LRNEPDASSTPAVETAGTGAAGKANCPKSGVDANSWASTGAGAKATSAAASARSAGRPALQSAAVESEKYRGFTVAASLSL